MLCRLSQLGIRSQRRWRTRRSRDRFKEKNRLEGKGREEEMEIVWKRAWILVGIGVRGCEFGFVIPLE